MPTFFEINVALAYYMFAQEKVDYAVMETGLGGTLDATNTISAKSKICILTKIGLDHTEILGKTISKIAEQKAGIIQNGNIVISHQSSVNARTAIKKTSAQKNSLLFSITENKNYSLSLSTPQRTIFNFCFLNLNLPRISLGLIGEHQAENCSLALGCLAILSERNDFNIDEHSLRSALKNIRIPGRMEMLKIKDKTVIIDGAHNPQKMGTFTGNLANIFPGQKFTFLIAFKKGKDYGKMLKHIIPLADKILLAQFSTSGMDNHLSSTDNKIISKFLEKHNFTNFSIMENSHSHILKNMRISKKPIVITGSLYFIGALYPHLKS